MRYHSIITTLCLAATSLSTPTSPSSTPQNPLLTPSGDEADRNISLALFADLEELSRVVDISYCVGLTGIQHPFLCASRCEDFPNFELVDTFNTGPLMSDSCGYIALDHGREKGGRKRVLVAFRGTYSIANTIVDLSTVPQEYVPYPEQPGNGTGKGVDGNPRRGGRWRWRFWWPWRWAEEEEVRVEGEKETPKCMNCTVHTGFWTSWSNTRELIIPHILRLRDQYPDYKLDLVGHSLGGAVAALAGLEFNGMGLDPRITTFGEPRIGNEGLRDYLDAVFNLPNSDSKKEGKEEQNRYLHSGRYRRITHIDDPVPLLPLQEWGYRAHAGEIYISKPSLQPTVSDVHLCLGDEDVNCIAGAEVDEDWFDTTRTMNRPQIGDEVPEDEEMRLLGKRWGIPIPARYKMWQLFFAHRDYFWRLGLCLPGGDPLDWGRERYRFGDGDRGEVEGREDL
ncbi:hypothetical protein HYFRA_00010389 [Hymenoscyphus fraxineus]|uniref:Fungal lipase-type domain-containing protein n=1 Tax=Hymenoscyphus fraxineus TaxID=746836 RepID=A0A9N9L3K7_9HELO|nr:hypothetical protein HYFRA_00010389 [Hymenoscyphus fraxineus]